MYLQRPVTATLATAGAPDTGALGPGQETAHLRIHAGAEMPESGGSIEALLRHSRVTASRSKCGAKLNLPLRPGSSRPVRVAAE
jgi:hypothetical protein